MRTFGIITLAVLAAGCVAGGGGGALEEASTLNVPPFLAVVDLAPNGMEYEFNPSSLVVTAGREVRLTVHNTGHLPHSFVVQELGIDSGELAPGQRTALTFTAREPGSFESMCDVGGHYEAGMKGLLVVRDA